MNYNFRPQQVAMNGRQPIYKRSLKTWCRFKDKLIFFEDVSIKTELLSFLKVFVKIFLPRLTVRIKELSVRNNISEMQYTGLVCHPRLKKCVRIVAFAHNCCHRRNYPCLKLSDPKDHGYKLASICFQSDLINT